MTASWIGVGWVYLAWVERVEHRAIEFQIRERHRRIGFRRRHVLVVRIVGRQFVDWNGDVRLGLVELVGFVVWLGQVGGGDGLGFKVRVETFVPISRGSQQVLHQFQGARPLRKVGHRRGRTPEFVSRGPATLLPRGRGSSGGEKGVQQHAEPLSCVS